MLPMFLSVLRTEEERSFVAELYEEYSQQMYRIAYKYLKNQYDAEDVVQDIFKIIADDHLGDVLTGSVSDRRRFLFVCARNRARNLIKSRAGIVSADAMAEHGFELPGSETDPIDELVADRDLLQRAAEEVKRMDPKYGEPLWMHLRGFTIEQTAKLFDENYETIKKRTYRAKLLLRKAVLGEGGEE